MTIKDQLYVFQPGQKVTAEETNDNNDTLEYWAKDNSASETYIDGKIAELNSTYSDQLNAINSQISNLQQSINTLSKLDNIQFKQKSQAIGTGTTSLSSYLPNDSKTYLVWVKAILSGTGSGDDYYELVSTDVMSDNRFIQLDGDSGRAQRSTALTVVPVGSGRKIKITKGTTINNADNYVVGYCRI